ncbi:MAG: helix-turn-helix domain-containing protein [Ruminococcaceae bacterium]|nr:helix-turn-helix domain-containing protein [Oscillospiraceae bacterium]
MSLNPTKAADNVYCKARKAAAKYNERLNSREGAAEALNVSVSTISDYELGLTKTGVPVEAVVRMADLYNAPELRNWYCSHDCPIGRLDVAPVKLEDLDRLVIELQDCLKQAGKDREDLLDIAADGRIDKRERPRLKTIIRDLDKIANGAKDLKMWAEKNLEALEGGDT